MEIGLGMSKPGGEIAGQADIWGRGLSKRSYILARS